MSRSSVKADDHTANAKMSTSAGRVEEQKRMQLMIFRPHMADGGADRVTITLLRHLDRSKFAPSLVLSREEGTLLAEVPEDVPVIGLGRLRLRSSWLSLARLLRESPPDILLSMSSPAGNPIASFAHLLARANSRLVLSRRNVIKPREIGTGRMMRPVQTMLYKRADMVIAISQGVADDLESILKVPREILSVIYNPLPIEILGRDRGEEPPHAWFRDSIPVLLAVGRLVDAKDYPTLLRAMALVRRGRPVRLIILGQGALERDLMRLSEDLGISKDVDFAGWAADPSSYMRWCTVFVLASQTEGLCTALMEALGSGAPAISTNCHAGPSEMIVSGENGILVPVANPEAMALAIENLLDDQELRRHLGENARRRAMAYSADKVIAAYERILLGEQE